jgi:hypothetical protein
VSSPKVRVLLDVDGVLRAIRSIRDRPEPGAPKDFRKHQPDGEIAIVYSPTVVDFIREHFIERPGVEVRWLTTWGETANKYMAPIFRWPDLAVAGPRDDEHEDRTGIWWKVTTAERLFAADPLPFVWADDDFGPGDDGATEWMRSIDRYGLMVPCRSHIGLTLDDLERMDGWVTAHLMEVSTR